MLVGKRLGARVRRAFCVGLTDFGTSGGGNGQF